MLPLVSTDTHATDTRTRSITAKPGRCKNNDTNPKNQMETEAASRHSVATNNSLLSHGRPSHDAAHLSLCSVTTWGVESGRLCTEVSETETETRNEVPYSKYLG